MWTPMASTFSMKQTVIIWFLASRTTSSSSSSQPSDRFLDQDLADQAGRQAPAGDGAQLLHVVDQAAAGAAHGVGRPDDDRVAESARRSSPPPRRCRRSRSAACRCPGCFIVSLKAMAVLAALDGIDLHADDLDAVLLEHARLGQLRREVQPGLAAQVRQQGVRPLLLDDLRHGRRASAARCR